MSKNYSIGFYTGGVKNPFLKYLRGARLVFKLEQFST